MSELKIKNVFLVDCHDLDKFVKIQLESFGMFWSALDTGYDGYHNGSYVTATVELGAEVEDDLDQDFARWLLCEGPFYLPADTRYICETPGIPHILQWLCNTGKIPEGEYVVELWW